MTLEIFFIIAILIMSVVIHEVAHGVSANWLGDPTARLQGRLTLNPVKHIDLVGSVIIPAVLVITSSPFLFGWAKPVPYNPFNFKRGGKWGEAMVAGAGPATNIGLAIIFGLVVQMGSVAGLSQEVLELAFWGVLINVMLAIFNMIPIPPLDGSKVVAAILPRGLAIGYDRLRSQLEYNPFLGFGIIILFILVFGSMFFSFIFALANFFAGI